MTTHAEWIATGETPEFLLSMALRDLEWPRQESEQPLQGFRLPGLVDLHIHGGFGWDFSWGDPDRIEAMLDRFIPLGLTGVVATIMTCSEDQRRRALNDLRTVAVRRHRPPAILGISLEGPFLAPQRRGSHPEHELRLPDPALLKTWQQDAGGMIKLITIAPELPGALDFIRAARELEIHPAIGHTDADHQTTTRALEAGAGHVTHLYNAMRPFTHRDPTAVSAILAWRNVTAELIADGIHVCPEIARLTFSLLGAERIALVSDGVCPMGLPDGQFDAYGTRLELKAGRCTFVGGHLFGGGRHLLECLPTLASDLGCSVAELTPCVSTNPCRAIGVDLPGGDVILDERLRWLATRHGDSWFHRP